MNFDPRLLILFIPLWFLGWSPSAIEPHAPPDRAPISDDGEPFMLPVQFVRDGEVAQAPAAPGAAIQIEPEPKRPRVQIPQGGGLIEPAPLAAKISGPEVARVGDMPQFNVDVTGGAPKLIQWTVDPAVTRMGEETTRLGIATPVEGQYRIRVLIVDEQFRRTEATWVCTIDPQGGPKANPTSLKDLSTEWTAQVAPDGVDGFATLQSILRDIAALIRVEDISSHAQLQATLDELMEQRLTPEQQVALFPWFQRFNAHLEVEERLGRLRTLQQFEVLFDRAADGLPIPTSH